MTWFRAGGGGIPASLKNGMNAVLNKKFGTSGQTYAPSDWPDDVNLLGKLPEKTASGEIANFSDGADDVPLKDLIFYASPIQAAGTPSPSNPLPISGHVEMNGFHTGKNLLLPMNADSAEMTVNGIKRSYSLANQEFTFDGTNTKTDAAWLIYSIYASDFALNGLKPNVTYRFSHNLTSDLYAQITYNKIGGGIGAMGYLRGNAGQNASVSFTLPSDFDSLRQFQIGVSNTATDVNITAHFQIEVGSSSSTFAPYSAETKKWSFPPFGKNQITSASAETKSNNSVSVTCDGNGIYTATGTATGGSANITFTLAKPYTIKSGDYFHALNSGANASVSITLQKQDNTSIMYFSLSPANRIVDLSSYVGQTIYSLRFYVASGAEFAMSVSPMICDSSTATSYEPYQSMFAGSVNALTGATGNKQVKISCKAVTGLYWNNRKATQVDTNHRATFRIASSGYLKYGEQMSNRLTYSANITGGTGSIEGFQIVPTAGLYFCVPLDLIGLSEATSATEDSVFLEAIRSYPDLYFICELADPIEIDMDSVDWQTQLGVNNFFNDCGDTSVTYRQDIDLALSALQGSRGLMMASRSVSPMIGEESSLDRENILEEVSENLDNEESEEER